MTLPYLDAATLAAVLPVAAAIDVLEEALLAGLDPAADPPRTVVDSQTGQLLVMPSAAGAALAFPGAGLAVKLVSVAPHNPNLGRPRVQGILVLFDPATLAPVALVDGIALTALRTPAVSALAVRQVAPAEAHRLVVFGTGPQAAGHIAALGAVRPIDDVVLVGRDKARTEAFLARVTASGPPGRIGTAADVAEADLVVCATTAREPLFDGHLIRDGAVVVAVGSHEPSAREVDAGLVLRSRIIVEDVSTALREAGDLVLAGVRPDQLQPLDDLVRRSANPTDARPVGVSSAASEPAGNRPTLIKTVGMAWEDAVVAASAFERYRRSVSTAPSSSEAAD